MSLKHVDIESAMRRLAERRIETAMEEGKFDNLAGKGKPLDLEPLPADEKARAMYWALRIMKSNDFVPDEVQWRKAIDVLKARLATATDEAAVDGIVQEINALVQRLNTLGTNAIPDAPAPLNPQVERERWRARVKHG